MSLLGTETAPVLPRPPIFQAASEVDVTANNAVTLGGVERRHLIAVPIEMTARYPWLPDVVGQVNRLLTLEQDWDSYGAHPVDISQGIAAIQWLVRVLDEAGPAPHISPMPDGGISLGWRSATKEIDVEFVASGQSVLVETPEGESIAEGPLQVFERTVTAELHSLAG